VVERIREQTHCFADLGDVAAYVLAMTRQHIDLVLEYLGLGIRGIPDIRVLRDHPQRLLLAATADQDRRPTNRLGVTNRFRQLLAVAVIGTVVVDPHRQEDLQRLCEYRKSLSHRRGCDAQGVMRALVPGAADPKYP